MLYCSFICTIQNIDLLTTQLAPGRPALGARPDAPNPCNVSIPTKYNTNRARPVLLLARGSSSRRAPRDHLFDANRTNVPPRLKTSVPPRVARPPLRRHASSRRHPPPCHHPLHACCPPRPIPTVLHHLATRSNMRCKHQKYYLFITLEQVYCNIRTRRLQQQNKATAMRDARSEKETNATKIYYLLQHQNKATATTEQSAMRESNIRKKTNTTKKYYLLQHQNKATTM